MSSHEHKECSCGHKDCRCLKKKLEIITQKQDQILANVLADLRVDVSTNQIVTNIQSLIGEECTRIRSYPFVISKPGKYCLEASALLTQTSIAIQISSDDVEIEGNFNVIDLGSAGGVGISIDPGQSGIQIRNLIFKNTGSPGAPAQNNITVTLPLAQIAVQTTVEAIQAIIKPLYQAVNPTASDNSKAAGILISNASANIRITNCIFDTCYVGIQVLGQVNNLEVSACQSLNCGIQYTDPAVVPPFRGGFLLAYNTSSDLSLNWKVNNNVLQSNNALFGILLYAVANSSFQNNISEINFGLDFSAVSESVNFGHYFCDSLQWINCKSKGGQDGIQSLFSTNGTIIGFEAQGFTDQGIDVDNTVGYTVQNCVVNNSTLTAPGPDIAANKHCGISAIISIDVVIENCTVSRIVDSPLLPFTGGIVVAAAKNVTLKNNTVNDSTFGIKLIILQNSVIQSNTVNGNLAMGLIFLPTSPLTSVPSIANVFISNVAAGNTTNMVNINPTVSISGNGTTAVAPYVNLIP